MTKLPNILVTGTPGTGKTTTASLISSALNYTHIDLSSVVKEHSLHSGFGSEFDSFLLDEDKVVDHLEDIMAKGGVCLDHHGSDFFPLRWFDLVVILTCETDILYDRLVKRGYQLPKVQENVECEIMRICYEEAIEGFGVEKCMVFKSDSAQDMETNVERVESWFEEYLGQNK